MIYYSIQKKYGESCLVLLVEWFLCIVVEKQVEIKIRKDVLEGEKDEMRKDDQDIKNVIVELKFLLEV